MIDHFFDWIVRDWVEVLGTILGTLYIFFSIKQNILTWLLGLLSSALYVYVFFVTKFYADMALQIYYVGVSIYGWILWARGVEKNKGHEDLPVTRLTRKLAFTLLAVSILLWIVIYFILKKFTDSPIPFGDAFTTAFSIVATWMLARKIIEQWIIWVVVDFVSLLLYIYKGLYPTTILFVIYTGAAVVGYFEWKKDLLKTDDKNCAAEETIIQ